MSLSDVLASAVLGSSTGCDTATRLGRSPTLSPRSPNPAASATSFTTPESLGQGRRQLDQCTRSQMTPKPDKLSQRLRPTSRRPALEAGLIGGDPTFQQPSVLSNLLPCSSILTAVSAGHSVGDDSGRAKRLSRGPATREEHSSRRGFGCFPSGPCRATLIL